MKEKKILLIHNDQDEVETIQNVIKRMNVKFSMMTVGSGREGLDVLMGSPTGFKENYFRSRKLRPDIVLLNSQLPDMSGIEFMEIVRKYYSLKTIKVLLLSDSNLNIDQEVLKRLSVMCCLQRPFENTHETFEKFKLLKAELTSNLAIVPLMSLPHIKSQLIDNTLALKKIILKGNQVGYTIGTKIAASVCLILAISGVTSYNGNTQEAAQSSLKVESGEKTEIKPIKEISDKPIVKTPTLDKKTRKIPELIVPVTVVDSARSEPKRPVRNIRIKFIEEKDSASIH